ncbi:MAG: hypothetical protein Q8J78_05345 [Moraxellaceae bacterium]|nr:hypothetical protein [Moraxellaceae bacterium]
MLRRSEDIFLEALDADMRSLIGRVLDEIDESNCDKAWELLSPLVEKKDPVAIYYASSFGLSAETLDEFERRRMEQLQQSAEHGYAPAIHELAIHYDSGELVPRDSNKAAKLFMQAAEKGHPHAQWIHGLDLLYGQNGMEKDEARGLKYIEKAAASKFEGALETMAEFYEVGKYGYPADSEKSNKLTQQIGDDDALAY